MPNFDLRARDTAERRRAAEWLMRHPEEARRQVLAVVVACGDADEEVRRYAAAVLEDLGPPAAEHLSALELLVDGPDADVAYWAVTLLGRLGPAAAPAAPRLADLLTRHSALAVRQQSAWALGQLGAAATDARPQLVAASQASDPRLARLARTALERLAALST